MLRSILLLFLSLILMGCTANYYHENFTTGIRGASFVTPYVDYYVNLSASNVKYNKTKSSGPWFFSFQAITTNQKYRKLIIESAVFTDLRGNKITLIDSLEDPVEMDFSDERRPRGDFAVNYDSKDRESLNFEFYPEQELILEVRFTIIDDSKNRSEHIKTVKFSTDLIEGRDTFNPFTDIT